MSAHCLLNLLKNLRQRDKIQALLSILSLFCNKVNKFNNARARMLDFNYHMTLRLLINLISAMKTLYSCHYILNVVMYVLRFVDSNAWQYFTLRRNVI